MERAKLMQSRLPKNNRDVALVSGLGSKTKVLKARWRISTVPFLWATPSNSLAASSLLSASSAHSFHFNITASNCRQLPPPVDTACATGRKPGGWIFAGFVGQRAKLEPVSSGAKSLPKKDVGCDLANRQISRDCNGTAIPASHNKLTVQTTMPTTSKSRRSSAVQTPLETYLREINETALLNAAEEKELAVRIGGGDSAARDRMVRANLRLVVNIARGYSGKGLSLQDLIEEGNLGLLRAVEGFDPAMGTRFSTYASYWIKQSIKRALINTGKTIRIPAYMVELLSKWRRATARLTEELDRSPTPEEIARVLGLPKKKLPIIKKAIKIYNATPQTDQAEAGWTLGDMVMDERQLSPDDTLVESDSLRHVMEMLTTMDEREATVLKMRFGLENYEPRTLKEIGEQLGLTRERVRQIETEALNRMADSLEDPRDRPFRF
jgi:RNA polymerase primary sigma factor